MGRKTCVLCGNIIRDKPNQNAVLIATGDGKGGFGGPPVDTKCMRLVWHNSKVFGYIDEYQKERDAAALKDAPEHCEVCWACGGDGCRVCGMKGYRKKFCY